MIAALFAAIAVVTSTIASWMGYHFAQERALRQGAEAMRDIYERALQDARANLRSMQQLNDRLLTSTQQATQELLTQALYGGSPQPARVEQLPSSEADLQRLISEASVARGAAVLMDRYREAGIPISEEEARTQAASMLQLRMPVTVAE